MFNKKRCPYCNRKIHKGDKFCPYCGRKLSENEDYGMLGKDDFFETPKEKSFNLFGGLNEKILNKMLGSAIKMLEREMQKSVNESISDMPRTHVKIMVNGKEINFSPKQKPIQNKKIKLPRSMLKGFSKLKKKEPKTSIKRLGNTIFYEIKLPNVKSIKDISINQLENSIEIKAKSNKEAYIKIIPINLPIKNYEFLKGKLTLELSE